MGAAWPLTYEVRAALAALDHRVRTGAAPPQSPRLVVNSDKTAFVLDANGNARGGIRTPQVEAPVAKLSGLRQPGSPVPSQPGQQSPTVGAGTLCTIFGTTAPFSGTRLASLFPSHAAFVKTWDTATAAEVRDGYLERADAEVLNKVAAQSNVGG